MLVVAMSKPGAEFLYIARSAHKVSKRSAQAICDIANNCKFLYSCYPGYKWHIHEITEYDQAYTYALNQDMIIRNGIVKKRAF